MHPLRIYLEAEGYPAFVPRPPDVDVRRKQRAIKSKAAADFVERTSYEAPRIDWIVTRPDQGALVRPHTETIGSRSLHWPESLWFLNRRVELGMLERELEAMR